MAGFFILSKPVKNFLQQKQWQRDFIIPQQLSVCLSVRPPARQSLPSPPPFIYLFIYWGEVEFRRRKKLTPRCSLTTDSDFFLFSLNKFYWQTSFSVSCVQHGKYCQGNAGYIIGKTSPRLLPRFHRRVLRVVSTATGLIFLQCGASLVHCFLWGNSPKDRCCWKQHVSPRTKLQTARQVMRIDNS